MLVLSAVEVELVVRVPPVEHRVDYFVPFCLFHARKHQELVYGPARRRIDVYLPSLVLYLVAYIPFFEGERPPGLKGLKGPAFPLEQDELPVLVNGRDAVIGGHLGSSQADPGDRELTRAHLVLEISRGASFHPHGESVLLGYDHQDNQHPEHEGKGEPAVVWKRPCLVVIGQGERAKKIRLGIFFLSYHKPPAPTWRTAANVLPSLKESLALTAPGRLFFRPMSQPSSHPEAPRYSNRTPFTPGSSSMSLPPPAASGSTVETIFSLTVSPVESLNNRPTSRPRGRR